MARKIKPSDAAPNPFADEQQPADASPPTGTGDSAMDAWIREASERAGETIQQNAEMGFGTVLPANPALRYSTGDGDMPGEHLGRWRAELEALGYRDVTADVSVVIGIANPVVYAIPKEVYRKVIRPARLKRQREMNDRFGMMEPHIQRPASVS